MNKYENSLENLLESTGDNGYMFADRLILLEAIDKANNYDILKQKYDELLKENKELKEIEIIVNELKKRNLMR